MNKRPEPAVAAVIGFPIIQSKSPLIHRFWLKTLGMDGDYVRLPVAPDDFETALQSLPALGLRGVNITMPYKRHAYTACDHLDPAAKLTGAVNTVVVDGRQLIGYNTDVDGFLEPLETMELAGGTVTVIGAGGAAAAVIAALAQRRVGQLYLTNRSITSIQQVRQQLATVLAHVPVRVFDWSERHAALAGTQLLINTSALGMAGQPPLDLSLDLLPTSAWVYDIITHPRRTALLVAASERGHPTINGYTMLIGQAARAFSLFYGVDPPRDPDSEAALKALLDP